jgi:hypothetical protein
MNSFLSKHTSFGSVGRGYVSLSLDILFYLFQQLSTLHTPNHGSAAIFHLYLTELVRIMDYKEGISD